MLGAEFWVMRAVLHQKGVARGEPVNIDDCTPEAFVGVLALVNAGDFCLLPDGTICEPVEVFRSQLDADAHMAQLKEKHPGEDFRVVLNMDVKL